MVQGSCQSQNLSNCVKNPCNGTHRVLFSFSECDSFQGISGQARQRIIYLKVVINTLHRLKGTI